uniref:Uncharacterized protein n=1 Tax=Candidatus Kentrum sp. LFY TaxID=2126342 RepID=A0A450V3J4_9GAMM|nr:MAG: hypothetical protein BECKLFY1418A_GA0070994_109717 [Candidatus Kentron sp. LFY]
MILYGSASGERGTGFMGWQSLNDYNKSGLEPQIKTLMDLTGQNISVSNSTKNNGEENEKQKYNPLARMIPTFRYNCLDAFFLAKTVGFANELDFQSRISRYSLGVLT